MQLNVPGEKPHKLPAGFTLNSRPQTSDDISPVNSLSLCRWASASVENQSFLLYARSYPSPRASLPQLAPLSLDCSMRLFTKAYEPIFFLFNHPLSSSTVLVIYGYITKYTPYSAAWNNQSWLPPVLVGQGSGHGFVAWLKDPHRAAVKVFTRLQSSQGSIKHTHVAFGRHLVLIGFWLDTFVPCHVDLS